jgi:membrane protein implicated in regulation of membrane protease activity
MIKEFIECISMEIFIILFIFICHVVPDTSHLLLLEINYKSIFYLISHVTVAAAGMEGAGKAEEVEAAVEEAVGRLQPAHTQQRVRTRRQLRGYMQFL